MVVHIDSRARRVIAALVLGATCLLAGGCAVVAVADAAASVAVKGAGLAADAAIGTVRLTGRAVGAAADLVIPGSSQ